MATNHYAADGEKRGKGRPKKDEIVTKPIVVHDFDKIKPENRKAYAHETIKNARNIYKKYNESYPNPLNVNEKDLTPEAKECWKYIFSGRNLTDQDLAANFIYERVFNDVDEILFAFECYSAYVQNHNYVKEFERPDGSIGVMPIVPNQTNLARWLGIASNTLSSYMSKANDYQIQAYKRELGNLLSEGAMAGIYQPASTIFALKNLCDWADKYEDRSVKKDDIFAVAEAQELMEKLGYVKKTELPPPVKELSDGQDL